MSDFTPEEITAITEAATLDNTTGRQRLAATFGDASGDTTIQLARAVKLVDQIRAGEAVVDLGDGTFFGRDVSRLESGGAVREVQQ